MHDQLLAALALEVAASARASLAGAPAQQHAASGGQSTVTQFVSSTVGRATSDREENEFVQLFLHRRTAPPPPEPSQTSTAPAPLRAVVVSLVVLLQQTSRLLEQLIADAGVSCAHGTLTNIPVDQIRSVNAWSH